MSIKSPFPGMDPWLEQHWGDVHASLIVYLRDQISEQLPSGLQARVEERLEVSTDTSSRFITPDVVVREPGATLVDAGTGSGTALATPLRIRLHGEPRTERHIEIVDVQRGHRIITVIELLSPANKGSRLGRQAYRQKQEEYVLAGVNLVEIDLIRRGEHIVWIPKEEIPVDWDSMYRVSIRRVAGEYEVELIRVPFREPLPNFAIPLRPADADIVIRLQPLLDECYRRGRYDSIDYTRPLDPPLEGDDLAWAMERITGR